MRLEVVYTSHVRPVIRSAYTPFAGTTRLRETVYGPVVMSEKVGTLKGKGPKLWLTERLCVWDTPFTTIGEQLVGIPFKFAGTIDHVEELGESELPDVVPIQSVAPVIW